MTDLVMDDKLWLDSYLAEPGERGNRADNGRHAFNEDAVLTPIFHALTSGGWRERQRDNGERQGARRAGDPVDAFHRDPLGAPIPQQALGEVPEQPRRRSSSHPMTADEAGRHRRRREASQGY